MATDGIWQWQGDNEAWAQIADARLIVLKNFRHAVNCDYGWRWVVVPMRYGHLDIHHAHQSMTINSEAEPYPSREAAMAACMNYYVREWHGD
jgi:hypothetical protein